MRACLFLSLSILASGCPSSTTQTGDAGSALDAARLDDAGSGVDAASIGDTGVVQPDTSIDAGGPCAYVDTIDRTCSTDADCHVGLHQTDCCGSSVMIGFRDTQQSLYASSESACMASYPACGCPATLPTTDSGETVTDTSMVHAGCITVGPGARCETYVANRPPNGR